MRSIEFVSGGSSPAYEIASDDAPLRMVWALVDICAGTQDPEATEALRACDSDSALYFDRHSEKLVGLQIRIPEFNLSVPDAVLGSIPMEKGLPIRPNKTETGLRTPLGRCYCPEDDRLFIPLELDFESSSLWKLEFGSNCALIVNSKTPVAWTVDHASLSLESPKTGPSKTPLLGTIEARRAIAAYLSLVDDSFIVRLETQDPAARASLRLLRNQCLGVHDGVGRILAEWADDILATFA